MLPCLYIFTYMKIYLPHICILQETHLTGGRILALKKPWVGSYYHSTYSSYSRGVSVLVHKSLQFNLSDLHLDTEERYVVLHALCNNLDLIIVGLYIPPHANMSLLFKLAPIIAQYPNAHIILTGDFIMPPNPVMDSLNAGSSVDSPLSRWEETYGLCDTWW